MSVILSSSAFSPLSETGSIPYGIPAAVAPDGLESREDDIARFTETAYHAVLERGYRGSFLELELSLWNAIRRAVEQNSVKFVSKEVA